MRSSDILIARAFLLAQRAHLQLFGSFRRNVYMTHSRFFRGACSQSRSKHQQAIQIERERALRAEALAQSARLSMHCDRSESSLSLHTR
jgi:hypothetical protein